MFLTVSIVSTGERAVLCGLRKMEEGVTVLRVYVSSVPVKVFASVFGVVYDPVFVIVFENPLGVVVYDGVV